MTAIDMNPRERGDVLFGYHGHRCCVCCEGYCPEDDSTIATYDPVYEFSVDGGTYVGFGYLAIRDDIAALPEGAQAVPVVSGRRFTFPAVTPPLNARPMAADLLDRITSAGLTVHDAGDYSLYVYLGDQPVGWTMPVKPGTPGIRVDDLPRLRAVAAATRMSIKDVFTVLRAASEWEATR